MLRAFSLLLAVAAAVEPTSIAAAAPVRTTLPAPLDRRAQAMAGAVGPPVLPTCTRAHPECSSHAHILLRRPAVARAIQAGATAPRARRVCHMAATCVRDGTCL